MNEITQLPNRHDIDQLQAVMATMPQMTFDTKHHFADGMYCRELPRPKGTTIVGKVHKREHFYIVLSGEVTISGDGYQERVKAPRIFVSKPGTKRAVYAHEDSVCITIHRTDSRDLPQIERELIESDDKAIFNAHNELRFDAHKFRALTKRIIDHEKPGFWSEWTEEQQQLYKSGQWREFSKSRGYNEEEMNDYGSWLDMVRDALNKGINPHSFTIDITTRAALANIARAGNIEEILKSSHAPFEDRNDI